MTISEPETKVIWFKRLEKIDFVNRHVPLGKQTWRFDDHFRSEIRDAHVSKETPLRTGDSLAHVSGLYISDRTYTSDFDLFSFFFWKMEDSRFLKEISKLLIHKC
ncbi:hypothetical protein NL108_007827 [Boleophthalmus pectinirostris]|nr:hypothetical protein NL108_007827 [Boleophthalmus pectinirostris]